MCHVTGCPVPYGLCHCGCGDPAPLAQVNRYRGAMNGYRKGEPLRYIVGHRFRMPKNRTYIQTTPYHEEDRGYDTPCWIWDGSCDRKGYGMARSWMKTSKAHRYFYMQEHGPIAAGLHLDHKCRTHPCVNPDHLEPVTPQENQRRSRGTRLTPENVREILGSSLSKPELARIYGIAPGYIKSIRAGKVWRDVYAEYFSWDMVKK